MQHLIRSVQTLQREMVGVFLSPVQRAAITVDPQRQTIEVTDADLARGQGAADIPSHAEHHLGVIIDGPSQEGVAFGDHRLDFEAGDEAHQVLRVRADVTHGAAHPGLAGIGPPRRLLLTTVLEACRQPALVVFDKHPADLTNLSIGNSGTCFTDHGIAGVVVGHGEHHARSLTGRHQFRGFFFGQAERFVAHHIDARLHERQGNWGVQEVRRHDGDEINPLIFWPLLLVLQQVHPCAVGSVFGNAQFQGRSDRNLGIGVHGTGNKVDVAVQTLGQTVDRSDERTLASPDHGRTETSS